MSRIIQQTTIDICQDCQYFNEYGRLDDQTVSADPDASNKHAAKIRAVWGDDATFTSGCGCDCPDHGIDAYEGNETLYEQMSDIGPDSWFSWSACEECGSTLGGHREHATAATP